MRCCVGACVVFVGLASPMQLVLSGLNFICGCGCGCRCRCRCTCGWVWVWVWVWVRVGGCVCVCVGVCGGEGVWVSMCSLPDKIQTTQAVKNHSPHEFRKRSQFSTGYLRTSSSAFLPIIAFVLHTLLWCAYTSLCSLSDLPTSLCNLSYF